MSQVKISESRIIHASPVDVYAVMSDYRVGHQAVLPKSFFSKVVVVQGGQGAGTVIEVHMNVYGAKRVFRQVVTEPEPGRVLVETDPEAGVATSFIVDPIGTGDQSRVTIATESRLSPGFQGFVERLFNPMIIGRIYKQELELLDTYVQRGL
jgi:hypothetical protein